MSFLEAALVISERAGGGGVRVAVTTKMWCLCAHAGIVFSLFIKLEAQQGGGGGGPDPNTSPDPPLPLFNKDKCIAIEHTMKKVLGSPKVKLQQNVDLLLF